MAEQIIRPRNFTDTATDSDLQNSDNFLWLDTANKAKKMSITKLAVVGDTAATESDLVAGSTLPIMTANGPKSLPGNTIAKAIEQTALTTYAHNVSASIAPEYNGRATAGNLYMHEGTLYRCKENCSGAWDSSKFEVKDVSASFELEEKICTYRLNDVTTPQILQNFETTIGQTNTARYRARDAVPQAKRKSGLILSYRLDGKPVSEYILHSSSSYSNMFRKDQYWFELGGKRILKNASAYYYNNNAVAIDNYLKDVVCSENLDLHLFFSMSSSKTINCYLAKFVNGAYSEFVG